MARIAGINVPDRQHTEIGLTAIYGIGRTRARQICDAAGVTYSKKVKDLSDPELERIRDLHGTLHRPRLIRRERLRSALTSDLIMVPRHNRHPHRAQLRERRHLMQHQPPIDAQHLHQRKIILRRRSRRHRPLNAVADPRQQDVANLALVQQFGGVLQHPGRQVREPVHDQRRTAITELRVSHHHHQRASLLEDVRPRAVSLVEDREQVI